MKNEGYTIIGGLSLMMIAFPFSLIAYNEPCEVKGPFAALVALVSWTVFLYCLNKEVE